MNQYTSPGHPHHSPEPPRGGAEVGLGGRGGGLRGAAFGIGLGGASHGTCHQRRRDAGVVPWDNTKTRQFSRCPMGLLPSTRHLPAPSPMGRSPITFSRDADDVVRVAFGVSLGGASHGTSHQRRRDAGVVSWDNTKRRQFSRCPMGPSPVHTSPTSAESHGTLPGNVLSGRWRRGPSSLGGAACGGSLGGASHGTSHQRRRDAEIVPWDNTKTRQFSRCPMGPPPVHTSPTSAESHGTHRHRPRAVLTRGARAPPPGRST